MREPLSHVEYTRAIGVDSEDAPNELLLRWLGDSRPEGIAIPISADRSREISTHAESFDCTPYLINEVLKRMIMDAPRLRWLSAGPQASASDFEWLGALHKLRGLSLRQGEHFSRVGGNWSRRTPSNRR
jgi:hypothetical protein